MLRILLYPFSILYNLVTAARNYQYDRGLKPSVRFDVPVIGIGNLTVGGTGKTPMVEYLIRLLSPSYKIATLSRGYGRKTKGLRFASEAEDASTIGDEPLQVYRKFAPHVVVAVCEDRAFAIPHILQTHEAVEVILMDDAFQHRRVRPSLNILLTDYNRPFYRDLVLPAGRLRESRAGAARADAIVVTKCPAHLEEDEIMEIEKSIREYAEVPVFFALIHYGTPVAFAPACKPLTEKIILVTGIANARELKKYLAQKYTLVEHVEFGDHHQYSLCDVQQLYDRVKDTDISIMTTEKDIVKLDTPTLRAVSEKLPLYYLPIETDLIKNGEDFDELVLNHVKRAE